MDVRVGRWRKLSAKELMLTVVLEKTLESPLDCKEIQPVHPKGNQPWTFIGRTDAEAPILWLQYFDCKESNQSTIKEINPECSLEGLMLKLKLKLQYFDSKNWLIWKDPDAGPDWRQEEKGTDRGWDGWMASPMQWTWVWVSSKSWWWTGKPGMLQSVGLQRARHYWATEWNWTNNGERERNPVSSNIKFLGVPFLCL